MGHGVHAEKFDESSRGEEKCKRYFWAARLIFSWADRTRQTQIPFGNDKQKGNGGGTAKRPPSGRQDGRSLRPLRRYCTVSVSVAVAVWLVFAGL